MGTGRVDIMRDAHGRFHAYAAKVNVTALRTVPVSALDEEDRASVPDEPVEFTVYVPAADLAMVEEAALDQFHRDYGINVLDDFRIEVGLPGVTCPEAFARAILGRWCEDLGLHIDDGQHSELLASLALLEEMPERVGWLIANCERDGYDAAGLASAIDTAANASEWTSAVGIQGREAARAPGSASGPSL